MGNKQFIIFICFSNSSSRPPPSIPPVLQACTHGSRGIMGVLPRLQESPKDQSCPQEHADHTEYPRAPRPRRAGDTHGGRRDRQHRRNPAHPRAPSRLLPLNLSRTTTNSPCFPSRRKARVPPQPGPTAPASPPREPPFLSPPPGWDIPSLRASAFVCGADTEPTSAGRLCPPGSAGDESRGSRRGTERSGRRLPARCRRSVRPAPPHARSRPGRA